MTTAHRPTFDPARGKEALRGPAYHQRLLPAHTKLKYRQPGQGGDADEGAVHRDLRAELLAAEAAHAAKKNGGRAAPPGGDTAGLLEDGTAASDAGEDAAASVRGRKRARGEDNDDDDDDGDGGGGESGDDGEDPVAKRIRILAETREIDADSSEYESGSDDESDDDSEAELQREMDRIRAERAEKRAKEEAERRKEEEDARVREIALGNPLLNKADYTIKRRWDDDVVFKNQARGTEVKKPKEFTNDALRSDFHRRFMNKYVR